MVLADKTHWNFDSAGEQAGRRGDDPSGTGVVSPYYGWEAHTLHTHTTRRPWSGGKDVLSCLPTYSMHFSEDAVSKLPL
ncbi:hypothetical protein V2G26_016080 [Clonostachys chloroleuca]